MKIFRLPDLGEGLQEAEVVEWRVQSGQTVAVDDPLLAVETAKAVVEIPSPHAARIERLFAKVGEIVHIGSPLVGFDGAGEEDEGAGSIVGAVATGTQVMREAPSSLEHAAAGIRAMPAVRALARKLGVDLAIVTPSGADGVITVRRRGASRPHFGRIRARRTIARLPSRDGPKHGARAIRGRRGDDHG